MNTSRIISNFQRTISVVVLLIFATVAQAQFDDPNQKYLMTSTKVQLEATRAIDNMYNFKFAEARKEFEWLKYRYPEHPLPSFLLGLNVWWEMQPNFEDTKNDAAFVAYMDASLALAEEMYRKDNNNLEAAFFESACHAFKGRLYAERGAWRKAAVEAKRSMQNLKLAKDDDAFSPEFMFGDALFNYYSVWIPENYKILRPVMALFPKGDKKQGIKRLRSVAFNAFYTRTEAQLYLASIYANEENMPNKAYNMYEYLSKTYPDNPYFERMYARICYRVGRLNEAEAVSLDILNKIERGMPGYESTAGRYASYFLGYIYHTPKKRDDAKAEKYFKLCLNFCEQNGATDAGYRLHSLSNLMNMSADKGDMVTAKQYAEQLKDSAPRDHETFAAAKAFLKGQRKAKGFWARFGF